MFLYFLLWDESEEEEEEEEEFLDDSSEDFGDCVSLFTFVKGMFRAYFKQWVLVEVKFEIETKGRE